MKIKKFQEADKEQVENLVKKSTFEIYNKPARNTQDLDKIKEKYLLFYVVKKNNQIIGTIGLTKHTEKTLRLRRMYVSKKYRGKGIGKRLLIKAINFSKKNNYKKIVLGTYRKNKDAIRFYENFGFKRYKKINNRIYYRINLK